MSLDSSFLFNPTSGGSFSKFEDENVRRLSEETTDLGTQKAESRSIIKKTQSGEMQLGKLHGGVLLSGSLLHWDIVPSTQPDPSSRGRQSPPAPPSIRASLFEPLIHQRTPQKEGTISPLCFSELYAAEENPKQAPPVCEIRIPTPQQQDDSICSVSGDTAPLANCGDADEYKNLYFCGQREIYTLHCQMYSVKEENRQLKRQLIEMQKQLYSYSRNKRSAVSSSATNSAWCIPPCSSSKRRRVRLEPIEETEAIRVPSTSTAEMPPTAMSSIGVRTSVSTEEYASDLV